jgi:hypothetical protein
MHDERFAVAPVAVLPARYGSIERVASRPTTGASGRPNIRCMRWLTRWGAGRERAPEKRDELSESYVSWREACEDLRTAYELWSNCAPRQRILAFSWYRAALDREEDAAHVHSHLAQQLRASAG